MNRKEVAAFDLKGARESRGLSQTAAAAILCTTQASVSRWEASGNIPDVFRKLWDQHWQLEGDANDKGTNRGARGAKRGGADARKGKQKSARRNRKLQSTAKSSGATVPANSQTGD